MKYRIVSIPPFDRQLKRLAKKYPSLKEECAALIDELEENPRKGKPMGGKCFKVRLTIASKGRGKSGGARVVTHLYVEMETVYLLSIYDKSEQADITDRELKEILSQIR
jgi:mRNA-degrading endonuclease RelE of RelBE toxin-antitoxin system